MNQEVLKEGRLMKKGSVSWKSRHFILSSTKLAYFNRIGETMPRGEIALDSTTTLNHVSKRPNSFQIITGTVSLTVCASSADEEKDWREAIENAVRQIEGDYALPESQFDREWQIVSATGQDFEMPTNYEMIKAIGHGAYGVVISAVDTSRDERVAIKKIPDVFEDLVDGNVYFLMIMAYQSI